MKRAALPLLLSLPALCCSAATRAEVVDEGTQLSLTSVGWLALGWPGLALGFVTGDWAGAMLAHDLTGAVEEWRIPPKPGEEGEGKSLGAPAGSPGAQGGGAWTFFGFNPGLGGWALLAVAGYIFGAPALGWVRRTRKRLRQQEEEREAAEERARKEEAQEARLKRLEEETAYLLDRLDGARAQPRPP